MCKAVLPKASLVSLVIVLTCATSVVSAATPASRWVTISDARDGQSQAFDPTSIRPLGDWLQVRILANFSPPRPFGNSLLSSYVSLEAVDCGLGRFAVIEATAFTLPDGQGDAISRQAPTPPESLKWKTPAPMSIGAVMIDTVCHARRTPRVGA